MAKIFHEWDAMAAAATNVMAFVPAEHVAHFVRDTVREPVANGTAMWPLRDSDIGLSARLNGAALNGRWQRCHAH
jgi:hypothetical protein